MRAMIGGRFGWLPALGLILAGGLAFADNDPAAPSAVTIHAKGVRLDDALVQLRKQTGNKVEDQREQYGAEVTNPAFDLDLEAVPFLRALDEIAAKAGVTTTPYTGDGSIGIIGAAREGAARPPVEYVGPFRVLLKQINQQRDFEAGTSASNVALDVAWEPRLRPMLLSIRSSRIEARDDQGREVKPLVAMESSDVALRPETPSAEVFLNLASPERSAVKLASLRFQAEITVPADTRTFRFTKLEEELTIQQRDLSVTFRGIKVDEQIWKADVEIDYPAAGPAFESFRQGLFNNRIWLEKADGSKFEQNGGFSSTGGVDGRLGFEYLFVDVPGEPKDYRLVYQAPGKVVVVPVEVEFRDLPLP